MEKSPLKTTIIQQCLTKIYLADPSALTAAMMQVYRAFGLSDAEINLIANAAMKRDYFYFSPLGRRLFQLDLGPLTLALIGAADHAFLDALLIEKGQGLPLCTDILDHTGFDWRPFRGSDVPPDPPPEVRKIPVPAAAVPEAAAPLPESPDRDPPPGSRISWTRSTLSPNARKKTVPDAPPPSLPGNSPSARPPSTRPVLSSKTAPRNWFRPCGPAKLPSKPLINPFPGIKSRPPRPVKARN